jgi:hypothetical protein
LSFGNSVPLEFGTLTCASASKFTAAANAARLIPWRKVRRPTLEVFT